MEDSMLLWGLEACLFFILLPIGLAWVRHRVELRTEDGWMQGLG